MISFLISICVLIAGYCVYGRIVERISRGGHLCVCFTDNIYQQAENTLMILLLLADSDRSTKQKAGEM